LRNIYWNAHVANATRDPKQRARCMQRVERMMKELTELKREKRDAETERGLAESAAWYDTSAELN
jgi:hypothetical protein